MNHFLLLAFTFAIAASVGMSSVLAADPQVGHMVYFELKDASPRAQQQMVDACKKYLSEHEGTVYFSAGVLAADLDRDVNVRDFHVALHLVFKNRAAHDKYQDDPRHLKFIEENKANWKSVRVFDSYVATDDK